jgi:hypothetical protein
LLVLILLLYNWRTFLLFALIDLASFLLGLRRRCQLVTSGLVMPDRLALARFTVSITSFSLSRCFACQGTSLRVSLGDLVDQCTSRIFGVLRLGAVIFVDAGQGCTCRLASTDFIGDLEFRWPVLVDIPFTCCLASLLRFIARNLL